jgi:hypothetical protein
MVRLCVCFAWLNAVAGCVTGRVRAEASLALKCPEPQIQLEEKRPGTWEARGCERMAVCDLPSVEGAEVSCVGGEPLTQKQ